MARTFTAAPATGPAHQRDRYGRSESGSKRVVWLVAAACAVLGAAALAWLAWGELQPRATGEVTQFQVLDSARVQVVLEVTRPVGQAGACTIEALGDGFAQVGLLDVALPASEGAVVEVQVTVATSEPATVAVVRSCQLS
ncbi:MAG: DUF4307 domain-containing protein [Beutenbergiaceae bacterium]